MLILNNLVYVLFHIKLFCTLYSHISEPKSRTKAHTIHYPCYCVKMILL